MIRSLLFAALAVWLVGAPAGGAAAGEGGDIVVEGAWARPMPVGTSIGAGYVAIRNAGDTEDRLMSVVSPRAGRTELHATTIVDDVMSMRRLEGGLVIEAGGQVDMAPGGHHIMFLDVDEPFAEGEEISAELVFERAGTRQVVFDVAGSAPDAHSHNHGHEHDHGHDHAH